MKGDAGCEAKGIDEVAVVVVVAEHDEGEVTDFGVAENASGLQNIGGYPYEGKRQSVTAEAEGEVGPTFGTLGIHILHTRPGSARQTRERRWPGWGSALSGA